MGVLGRMEVEVEIKSSADVFHKLFRSNPHQISNIIPHKIQSCDVHQDQFNQPGSVLEWNYCVDGENITSKVIIEEIDEEKKLLRFKNIEGTLLETYKSLKSSIEVKNKGDTTVVKWAVEFEKIEDYGPYPTNLMDFVIGVTRDIETHHLNE